MFSIEELSQAFANYRKKVGSRGKISKYPPVLRGAVSEFRSRNSQMSDESLADILGISVSSLVKWCKGDDVEKEIDKRSEFIPATVEGQTFLSPVLKIEGRGLTVQFTSPPIMSDIEKVIKLLIAG